MEGLERSPATANTMSEEEETQLLARAIIEWGVHSQVDMVIEECAELIQAINKMKRMGGFDYPAEGASVKYALTYTALCSEVADVKIMIKQLEMILSKEAIQISYERKLERLKALLTQTPTP